MSTNDCAVPNVGLCARMYEGGEVFLQFVEVDGEIEAPVDLTGWTAKAQVRPFLPSPEVWLEITDITLGADGMIEIRVPGASVSDDVWLSRVSGEWDLRLKRPDDTEILLVQGAWTLTGAVTRGGF